MRPASVRLKVVLPAVLLVAVVMLAILAMTFLVVKRVSEDYQDFLLGSKAAQVEQVIRTAVAETVSAGLTGRTDVSDAYRKLAARELELLWKTDGLYGVIRSGGTIIFSSVPQDHLEDVLRIAPAEGIFRTYHGLFYENGYAISIPSWGWKVVTVAPPVGVTHRNSIVFLLIPVVAAGGGLLIWGVLLILRANLERPVSRVLAGIASGSVERTGVREIDLIGDAVNGAFASLAARGEQLRVLHDVAISIPQASSLEAFLNSLLAKATKILKTSHAGIWVFDAGDGEVRLFLKAGACCPVEGVRPECADAMRRLCHGAAAARSVGAADPAETAAVFAGCDAGLVNYLSRAVRAPKANVDLLLIFANKPGGFADSEELFVNAVAADAATAADRFHDEEALRRAMADLEAQNQRLCQLDRMKDGLIRDVTHELKTPVAKHAMQIELLRDALGESCREQIGTLLDIMERSVERQQLVIRNLLDLSRLEAGGRKYDIGKVPLDRIIARVVEDYRSSLESGEIALTVVPTGLTVAADEEMLWHVFSNLINNAVKFRRRDVRGWIRIEAAADGGHSVVRVRDNGQGLEPEDLGRVFERFYQASASTEGSGVGLSICRTIVEDMKGKIWMESEGINRGVTVIVRLPLA